MSSVSGVKLKTNCDAVDSGSFINQVTNKNSSVTATTANNTSFNNGTKLNQSDIKIEPVSPSKISIVKQETSVNSNFQTQQQQQIQGQNISSDVQKVLKQEQELQKQLYSGANVASGWLRVNHNNKVIYISPSGIGLASLKQVKDYLLTRGTCKCGLPFPLRVELFFNFSIEVPTVPLKTQIDSIKFDPTCQHRKKLTTTNQTGNSSSNNNISGEFIDIERN
ncbi:hypothetical protein PVAND_000553 [Polypedilum vanderplanki]|uniref:MBD domain-containing protein n=1 Tax=Polypedilum vanderplanki TaxID=319348 RepID=A0A9J6BKB3_POLVA|nr:hypothetical protein PVAND_000553 [Polypedilum vanderplanki]